MRNKTLFLLFTFLFLVLFITPCWAATGVNNVTPDGKYYTDRLYVKLLLSPIQESLFVKNSDGKTFSVSSATQYASLRSTFTNYGVTKIKEFAPGLLRNTYTIYCVSGKAQALIESLNANFKTIFQYAEGVPVVKISAIPNDPEYSYQWYLSQINASAAWDKINTKVTPVIIAIVDDAVKITHEDLAANIWINSQEIAGNGIDDDGNGYIDDVNGYDVADNDNNPNPPATANSSNPFYVFFTHGTHVAGIAGAVTNNSKSIASVSDNMAKIMAVKTKYDSDTDDEFLEASIEGVVYAIKAGANVINMSWGGGGWSQTEQDLFDTAYNKGIICVAAAGNDNKNVSIYPASYNHVISVGATDVDDYKTWFSNYGKDIDVMAPGVSIFSTFTGDTQATVNSYGYLAGTSMASPLVAGLCALMRSQDYSLTPDTLEMRLKASCDNIDSLSGNSNFKGNLGAGRINAYKAIASASLPDIVLKQKLMGDANNNQIDPGEAIKLVLVLKNIGFNVTGLQGVLTSTASNVKITQGSFNYGTMNCGDIKKNSVTPFIFSVTAPVQASIPFSLSLTGDGGYTKVIDFVVDNTTFYSGDIFSDINAGLPGVGYMSSTAWGDYDNDGKLDILLSGEACGYSITKIYHNNGNGTFTDINAGLPGANCPNGFAWGDYDNDGRLDILLAAWISGIGYATKIYHNNGDGTFSDINAGLPGVWGNVAWGDYDNDGRLDILISGDAMTKIYHNNGNGTFSEINAGLLEVECGSVAWGDYDNDGRLDILISGDVMTKIYHNNGNGTFTDINAGLAGFWGCSLAWGDYDNDGRLDILLSGLLRSIGYTAKIYHNNGNGTFSDVNVNLSGGVFGDVAWGDYDNDGKLDILTCGSGPFAKIYHNDGNGIFTDINTGLPGIGYSSASWGDYDNDGRLDILLTGERSGSNIAKIYHNDLIIAPNTLPNIVANSKAVISNNSVTLSWLKTTDNQTPQNGLSYNIFVSKSPTGVDVESPMAQLSDGWREIATIGSQNENTSWTIKNLANGTYYWGVQAVDTAFAGSPFVTGTFNINAFVKISGMFLNTCGFGLETAGTSYSVDGVTKTTSGATFTITVPYGWSGTITPKLGNLVFNSSSKTYTNVTANLVGQNFIANDITISGRVTNLSLGKPMAGVQIVPKALNQGYVQCLPTSVYSDANGNYTITVPAWWYGTLTAVKSGCTFLPATRTFTWLTDNQKFQNFVYQDTTTIAAIKGKLTYDNTSATALGNVQVSLKDSVGKVVTTTTDSSGNYAFNNINSGTYTITASNSTKPKAGVITPADALMVNNYYIGKYQFPSALKLKAADVNKDNKVNPTDALLINKYYTGLITSFPAGAWLFESKTVTVGTTDVPNINLKGICVGDVDGSYK